MTLADRVIVITGGSRGIGRAIAGECVRAGAHVVVCGRDPAAVDEAVSAMDPSAGSVCGMAADVTNYEAVVALRDMALERYGRIDVWFNNAGISLGYRPIDETDPTELARIVDINLTGHLYGCRAILPLFRQHGGYLMNMAGRGYRGEATPHTAAYAATKSAIVSLTRSIAAENRGVRSFSANALVPGMVETRFYENIETSPRLEQSKDNWRFAMNAFGVPLVTVAREAAVLLGEPPGRRSGKVLSLLTPLRVARGSALMAWYGMSGRMKRE